MLGPPKTGSRRASAALEFAIIAPIAITLMIGVFDLARACIVWEQTCSAAQAIADAAEKLSYTVGSSLTQLTSTQMQAAMSAAYAQIPGLSLGNGTSSSGSSFIVTLSEVVFVPTCTTSSGCSAQVPYVSWSTTLTQTGVSVTNSALRACGALTPVATFPDNSTQLTEMVSWSQNQIAMAPQVVADVQTTFVPTFSIFMRPVTFWSSAAVPAPIGGPDQVITYNSAAPAGSVQTCTVPSS
jgi:Flp pilus assembly protein TadG